MSDIEKNVEKLLKALDDERIQAKIKEIVSCVRCENGVPTMTNKEENDFERLYADKTKECEDLHIEMENRVKIIGDLMAAVDELKRKKSDIENDYLKLEDSLKQQLSKYEEFNNDVSAKMDNLESENSRLNGKIQQLEFEKKQFESEIEKHVKAAERLESEKDVLLVQNKDTMAAVKRLESMVDEPMAVYEEYKYLCEDERSNLRSIISDKDLIAFIASCSKPNTLDSLWDYIKNLIFRGDNNEEIRILSNVFSYFFDLINRSAVKPLYEADNVEIGDTYDDELHIRTPKGGVQGKIKKIELVGYKHAGSGNSIKKSVVTVGVKNER